jgi:hypothetical protein
MAIDEHLDVRFGDVLIEVQGGPLDRAQHHQQRKHQDAKAK